MRDDDEIELRLEGAPTSPQKERLEEFLSELAFISAKYQLLLEDPAEGVSVRDLDSGNVIGLGLGVLTAPGNEDQIRGYLPMNSILDGCWPVDSDCGMTEQRMLYPVHPQRDPPALS